MSYCTILFIFTLKKPFSNVKILQCLYKYFEDWNVTTAFLPKQFSLPNEPHASFLNVNFYFPLCIKK